MKYSVSQYPGMAYQLQGHLPMPMSCFFWFLAWAYPCFPPKKRMDVFFTYKQKPYRLQVKETPERIRRWNEVLHFFYHLPEFVNEKFDTQQMDHIYADLKDYVTSKVFGHRPVHEEERAESQA